jgi:hypothetical protein
MIFLTILSVVLLALLAYTLYEWGQALKQVDDALSLSKGDTCEDDDCDCGQPLSSSPSEVSNA